MLKRHLIGLINLISWLRNVLWNSYFLSELLFQSFYFLRTATFLKQLLFRKSHILQDFFAASLVFTATFSIYQLVINPINTRVFRP